MSTLEMLMENLRKFGNFKLYVTDRYNDKIVLKQMAFSANNDGTWTIIIQGTINCHVGSEYPDGIMRDVMSDDVYDIVANLFYRKDAHIVFDENLELFPGPSTEFHRLGKVLSFGVEDFKWSDE